MTYTTTKCETKIYRSCWSCPKCDKLLDDSNSSKTLLLKKKSHKKMCDRDEAMTLEEIRKRNVKFYTHQASNMDMKLQKLERL